MGALRPRQLVGSAAAAIGAAVGAAVAAAAVVAAATAAVATAATAAAAVGSQLAPWPLGRSMHGGLRGGGDGLRCRGARRRQFE